MSRRLLETPEEVKEEFIVPEERDSTANNSKSRQQVQGAMRSPEDPPRQGLTTAAAHVRPHNFEEADEETFGAFPQT